METLLGTPLELFNRLDSRIQYKDSLIKLLLERIEILEKNISDLRNDLMIPEIKPKPMG